MTRIIGWWLAVLDSDCRPKPCAIRRCLSVACSAPKCTGRQSSRRNPIWASAQRLAAALTGRQVREKTSTDGVFTPRGVDPILIHPWRRSMPPTGKFAPFVESAPLQALVTLNDPVYIEAAQALARRIVNEGGSSTEDRVRYGFRLVLSRPPHDNELARLLNLFERSLTRFSGSAEDATRMATDPLGPADKEANVAELAAWTVVGNVLFNLDETVMKR